MTRAGALRRGFAVTLSALVAAAGAWIRLTPFNGFTHALSVGSAEIAPWLIAGAMVALVLAMPDVRRRWSARVTAVLAVAACVWPAGVIAQINPAYREIDRVFENAFRGQWQARLPISQLVRLRERRRVHREHGDPADGHRSGSYRTPRARRPSPGGQPASASREKFSAWNDR